MPSKSCIVGFVAPPSSTPSHSKQLPVHWNNPRAPHPLARLVGKKYYHTLWCQPKGIRNSVPASPVHLTVQSVVRSISCSRFFAWYSEDTYRFQRNRWLRLARFQSTCSIENTDNRQHSDSNPGYQSQIVPFVPQHFKAAESAFRSGFFCSVAVDRCQLWRENGQGSNLPLTDKT